MGVEDAQRRSFGIGRVQVVSKGGGQTSCVNTIRVNLMETQTH